MQSLKIIGLCILASIAYGVIHDQITARICVEYFSVFHPPILGGTESPTLLALGWGVIATWWVGALLGVPLAVVAQAGPWPRLTASDLLPMIRKLLIIMACCAITAGIAGYLRGVIPQSVAELLPLGRHKRFLADWWAHIASYGSGVVGGMVIWMVAFWKRLRAGRSSERVNHVPN